MKLSQALVSFLIAAGTFSEVQAQLTPRCDPNCDMVDWGFFGIWPSVWTESTGQRCAGKKPGDSCFLGRLGEGTCQPKKCSDGNTICHCGKVKFLDVFNVSGVVPQRDDDDIPYPYLVTGYDPKITLWNGLSYSFDGICDLMFMKNPGFGDGLGMEIQVRTKEWSGPGRPNRSKISNLALKLGEDVFEVGGTRSNIQFWLNGEWGIVSAEGNLQWADSADEAAPAALSIANGRYTIAPLTLDEERFRFRIIFGKDRGHMFIEVLNDFVNVIFINPTDQDFGTSVGLMGGFANSNSVDRNGNDIEVATYFEYGQYWQVKVDETSLFHEVEGPQAPAQCIDISEGNAETALRH